MMALQSSDSLKIKEDSVRKKIWELLFSLKKIYIAVKTHARIISDGLTIRGSPLPKKWGHFSVFKVSSSSIYGTLNSLSSNSSGPSVHLLQIQFKFSSHSNSLSLSSIYGTLSLLSSNSIRFQIYSF